MTLADGSIYFATEYANRGEALKGHGVNTGFGVSQRAAGANMSVDVAAGTACVNYLMVVAGGITNKVVSAADATNPRIDIVTLKSDGTLTVTAGTAAANPAPPSIPSNEILLAFINVAANASSITTANCTDKREFVLRSQPPIGTLLMWLKSLTGVPQTLPYGYVACDGSTISDAESPMNGTTLPNLTSNSQALMPFTSSGNTATNWTNIGAGISTYTFVAIIRIK